MASVKLTNVQKVYDNKVIAVNDFNLEIADKEFVVFVGPPAAASPPPCV